MQIDSLVIFKNRPARVIGHINNKTEIQLETEKIIKLPEKNILLLHNGGFKNFDLLHKELGEGELIEAWNLLQGTETTYHELSELIYGIHNCTTVYHAWKTVQKNIYFFETNNKNKIGVNSPEQVLKITKKIQEKIQKSQAIHNFVQRLHQNTYLHEDELFIKEIISHALGKSPNCRFLKLLNKEETPINAHELLLKIGYWDEFVNPYPQRANVCLSPVALKIPITKNEDRYDLTNLACYAIDNEDSFDPDDAISFDEKTQKIWVHVADPASIVTANSEIDKEARNRGSNIYLPEGTISMLPPQLTEKFALGLSPISFALSIGFRIVKGEVTDVEVILTKIRVTRLNYQEAEEKLHEPPFLHLIDLSSQFNAQRHHNGAIDLQFPETQVKLHGKKIEIIQIDTLNSRKLVRELMLMAGVAIANFSKQNQISLPFSTQPDHNLTLNEQNPKCLAQTFMIRRKLQKGQYKAYADKHASMGLTAYVQVTSPLRRYLDLVVHQQLRSFLKSEKMLTEKDILMRIGESEASIKAARQADILSGNHWKCVYLMQHPEWKGNAIVIEKRQNNHVTVFIPSLSLTKRLTLKESVDLNTIIEINLKQIKLSSQSIYFQT